MVGFPKQGHYIDFEQLHEAYYCVCLVLLLAIADVRGSSRLSIQGVHDSKITSSIRPRIN